MVILGKQAIDDDSQPDRPDARRPARLAAGHLRLEGRGRRRAASTSPAKSTAGSRRSKLKLPAIVTTDLRLNEPRYASLPNIMKAKSKPLATKTPADYGVDIAPRLETLKVAEPPKRQAGIKVGSVDELVAKLKALGVVGMKTLVLVEHDGGADQGRHPRRGHRRVEARRSPSARRRDRASARSPRRPRRSPASARSMSPTPRAYDHQLAENVAPLAAGLMADHDAFLAPATTTGKNIAPRVAALLDVMQISRHPVGRGRGHLHPPDLRRQRHRHGRSRRDAKKVITVRGTAFEKAAREGGIGHGRGGRRAAATRACRASSAPRSSKSERPELTSAKIIVSGGRAFGSSEQFHALLDPLADKLGAGGRRQPRRGRRGLCAQRLSGRPDRQDRRPRSLYRDRHFRRDPAPRGHEGFEDHRRHQQGRGRADLPGRRHRPGRRPVQDRPGADREALEPAEELRDVLAQRVDRIAALHHDQGRYAKRGDAAGHRRIVARSSA